MILNLKDRQIRRIGPRDRSKSAYVILPNEWMDNYDVKVDDVVEMYMDTDRPNELVIRKKTI